MSANYIAKVGTWFDPEPSEPVMKSLFQQYERVLVESLVTSFGLDILVRDQHGGDVDTIHNVRQIGKDDQMTYKNAQNQKEYEERGDYNSIENHRDPRYMQTRREVSARQEAGSLRDAYTGKKLAPGERVDLDHVISAKEIHDDPGRVLAGLKGTDLANSPENLKPTNPHTNRSKNADSMSEYLDSHGHEYSAQEQARMRRVDANARKSYDAKIAQAYYTSSKFAKDLSKAAGNVGVRMGMRQALGFVFTEMWFAVKEEFRKIRKGYFDLKNFLHALGEGVKRGFERAKEKYQELFSKFLGGAIAGALSSLVTTLCNIFFTTAKNVVRIIRQSFASLVEAAKILFINPENYTFGERMRAVAKILATGASVVVGIVVSEAVGKTGIGAIPVVGGIVQTFCSTFVSGIMSCTLLYFLDRNEMINKAVKALDQLHTIETEISYYRRQADYFEQYAAKLANIDVQQLRKEISFFGKISAKLESAKTDSDLNTVLKESFQTAGILMPWGSHDSLDDFMRDKTARLVFE